MTTSGRPLIPTTTTAARRCRGVGSGKKCLAEAESPRCYGEPDDLAKSAGRCRAVASTLEAFMGCNTDAECKAYNGEEEGACDKKLGILGSLRGIFVTTEHIEGSCGGTEAMRGVAEPEKQDKCKAQGNPTTCADCQSAGCTWCLSQKFNVNKGKCVKSAHHCTLGSIYYVSKASDSGSIVRRNKKSVKESFHVKGSLLAKKGKLAVEVQPVSLIDSSQCPKQGHPYAMLRKFFRSDVSSSDFRAMAEMSFEKRLSSLDRFNKIFFSAMDSERRKWLEELPTAQTSMTPETYKDSKYYKRGDEEYEADFGGIKVYRLDEDWPEEGWLDLILRDAVNFITSSSQVDKQPVYFGTMRATGSNATLVNGGMQTQDASEEYKEGLVDAESKALYEHYYGTVMPPKMSQWTTEDLTSDKGFVKFAFSGIGTIYVRSRKDAATAHMVSWWRRRAPLVLTAKEALKRAAAMEEEAMADDDSDHVEKEKNHNGALPEDPEYDHREVHCFNDGILPPQFAEAVFCLDLSWMAGYEVRVPFERYGGTAYFGRDKSGIKLLGITRPKAASASPFKDAPGPTEDEDPSSPWQRAVSTPGSPDWDHMKWVIRVSTLVEVTAIDHLLWAHMIVSNGVTFSSRRIFDKDHPIRQLLKPFTFRANTINFSAFKSLFAESGMVDHWMAFTRAGLAKYMERGSKTFRFKNPVDMLSSVGLPVPRPGDTPAEKEVKMNFLISTTPLIADGMRLFNIYFDFAMNYLKWAYPEGEAQLAADSQLKEYWMDLDNHRRHGGRENQAGGYYYFPPEYSLCDDEARPGCITELTFDKTAMHLAHLMFYVTGYHRVIGNCADYLETGARGIALVIREGFAEAAVADYMGVSTLFGFTGFPQINLINDWNHVFTPSSQAKKASLKELLQNWQDALVGLGRDIAHETKTIRVPKNMPIQLSMDPRFLDSSIAI